jgi:hypothetical protein
MAAQGVLVFDDGDTTTVQGGTEQAFVVLDQGQDVLVVDAQPVREAVDSADPATDFIVFDTGTTITETVQAPADFLLVDPPKDPARVVLAGDPLQDLYVLTPGGPPGPPGPQGDTGPQGAPGVGSPFEYQMPVAQTTALVDHTLGRDPVAVQVLVDGVQASEFEVVFTIPQQQIRVGFDIPALALIRLF